MKRLFISILLLAFILSCSTNINLPPFGLPIQPAMVNYTTPDADTIEINMSGQIMNSTYMQISGIFSTAIIMKKKTIILNINSGGGEVFASTAIIAIIEELKAKGIKIITRSRGLTASGAFIIFISGTERVASKHSIFMIHGPRVIDPKTSKIKTEFDEDDMAAITIRLVMGKVLKDYTGLTEEQIKEFLNGEEYFTAPEAKLLGIVDKVE